MIDLATAVLHPKCGKRFRNSDRVGHCATCCETFVGLDAFDRHRVGGQCRPPVDGERGFWIDELGWWHYSPPGRSRLMSAEAKAARFK